MRLPYMLVALTGIIGCGKTTTLRKLFEVLLKEDKILVSKSLSVDKNRALLNYDMNRYGMGTSLNLR
jgi:type II secretory pathway predicted ATPase ExeA